MGILETISLLIFWQMHIPVMLSHNLKLLAARPKEVTKSLHVGPAAKTYPLPPTSTIQLSIVNMKIFSLLITQNMRATKMH